MPCEPCVLWGECGFHSFHSKPTSTEGEVGSSPAPPPHPQTAYLRMGTPSSFSGDLPRLAHGRVCVYSVETIFLWQKTRPCLNDSSYGKTICLQPAPKYGLCVVAGTASTKWAGSWETRTATRPDNQVAPALALPYLTTPLNWSTWSAGQYSLAPNQLLFGDTLSR